LKLIINAIKKASIFMEALYSLKIID